MVVVDIPNWTCIEGAKGHVTGPAYSVDAVVVQVAPASIKIRFTSPDGVDRQEWFNTDPGKRYLHRHGDTAEWGLRFEPEETVHVPTTA